MRRNRQSKIAKRAFKKKQAIDIFYITFCALVAAGLGYHFQHTTIQNLLSPVARVQAENMITLTPTLTAPLLVADSNANPTQDEIESYIRRIFYEDPETAVAISRTECPNQPVYNYPKCHLYSAVERSVGIMQVNIQSESAKVWWAYIPGTTFNDKVLWLEDPFNNVLFAHWIYSREGFSPWSSYDSGDYAANL